MRADGLLADDFRAVDLRAVDFWEVDFWAVVLRPVDLREEPEPPLELELLLAELRVPEAFLALEDFVPPLFEPLRELALFLAVVALLPVLPELLLPPDFFVAIPILLVVPRLAGRTISFRPRRMWPARERGLRVAGQDRPR